MKFSNESGARGRKRYYELGYRSRPVRPYKTLVVFCCLTFAGIATFVAASDQPSAQTANALPAANLQEIRQTASAETTASPTTFATTQKEFTPDIQRFLKKKVSSYGIYVGDPSGVAYAQVNADKRFNSASVYKLYVAYLGYQQLDSGKVEGAQSYNSGHNRVQCLDAMIRVSDSPCAEKLASELGKSAIDVKLKSYGLTDTSVRSLTTTARDASRMLSLIQAGTDLSSDSRARLLDSMQGQKYRNGIPKGFASSTVFNKVGFRDLVEYNDVALVKLADGRIVTVSIMTENTSVKAIAQLSVEINRLLQLQ